MRMATVGRLKPSETDILHNINHPRRRRPLSPRWLPDLFLSSFIPEGDIVPENDFSDMNRGPTVFDSMFHPDLFPSMFDIRPGRRRRYELPSLHSHDSPFSIPSAGKSTDFKKPVSPSSNVRVIPIKVEHGPRQNDEKRTSSSIVSNSGKKSPYNTISLDSDPPKSKAGAHSVDSKRLKDSKSSRDKYIIPDDDADFPIIIDNNECIKVPITVISDTAQSDSPSKYTRRTSSSRFSSSESKAEVQNKVEDTTKSSIISKNTNSNNNSSGKQNTPLSSSDSHSHSAIDDARNDEISASVCSPLESRNPSFGCLSAAYAEECESQSVSEEQEINPAPSYPIYDVLKVRLARENRKIDYIRGDGNCFFRALSKQLYGTEKFHKAVRNLIVDIIATNKPRFEPFVDKENVQEHVERMSEDHCWATTCEIYAAATLLQRDIYMLTPDHLNETYSWLLFKPIFTSTQQLYEGTHHPCYITMCNTNGNHYDRIVPDHGGCNCFAPHPALDGVSGNVDLTS